MVWSFLTLPASPVVRVIFLHQSARAIEAGIFSHVPCAPRRLYIPICFGKCSKFPLRKEKKKKKRPYLPFRWRNAFFLARAVTFLPANSQVHT